MDFRIVYEMLEIRLAAKKSLKKPWNKTTKAKQPICEKISFDFTNKKHYLKCSFLSDWWKHEKQTCEIARFKNVKTSWNRTSVKNRKFVSYECLRERKNCIDPLLNKKLLYKENRLACRRGYMYNMTGKNDWKGNN